MMDEHGNPLERDHSLCVVLPGGLEKKALVHGSKPVMDLLVTLCASYHLNPSDYTVEVLSPNKNNISFKPNSPIGSLEAEKIVLKPKGLEEKIRAPYMPEATVRLLINYNKSHKAVVRVNPRVPLEMLLPVVCDKCELRVETTVLLRDCRSTELLDMNKTLNDHGLREVFARDTAVTEPGHHQRYHNTSEAVTPTESISTPLQDLPKKEKKQKENTGFLSLFRKKKKKDELERAASAPTSPGAKKQASVSANTQALSSCTKITGNVPKKRQAPQPPMGVSQSVPNNLSTCHLTGTQTSAESTLRSTKRRAPLPPCANTQQELQEDTQVQGTLDSLNTLEELGESDESDSVSLSVSSSSSPYLSKPQSSSWSSCQSPAHLHHVAEPYRPSFRGKDISDARCALANILTSSVSKGMLFKRLKNSTTLPKLHNSSSLMSLTQQCPDNDVCAELESILNSKLPTEPEWEDPAQKKGMTTFKVVPSKKPNSQDPDINLYAADQCQETAGDNEDETSSDAKNIQTEKDSYSHTSETETALILQTCSSQDIQAFEAPDTPPPPLVSDNQECPASALPEFRGAEESMKKEDNVEITSEGTPAVLEEPLFGVEIHSKGQSEFPLSPNKDIDYTGLYANDKEAEEDTVQEKKEEGEENVFPPPPPPIFFNEDLDILEGQRDDPPAAASTSMSSSQPTSSGCNGQTAFSDDHPDKSSLAMSAATPMSPEKTSAAPSRFAQAVALAVQRSRFQSQGKALGPQSHHGPHDTLPSTHRSTYQYGA